jgi:hypothetical protein
LWSSKWYSSRCCFQLCLTILTLAVIPSNVTSENWLSSLWSNVCLFLETLNSKRASYVRKCPYWGLTADLTAFVRTEKFLNRVFRLDWIRIRLIFGLRWVEKLYFWPDRSESCIWGRIGWNTTTRSSGRIQNLKIVGLKMAKIHSFSLQNIFWGYDFCFSNKLCHLSGVGGTKPY